MYLGITITHFKNLLEHAAELGGQKALIATDQLPRYINKSNAYTQFGRHNVDHWVKERLIQVIKDGDASDPWRLDRIELESVAFAIECQRYFEVTDVIIGPKY